jgi:hypothetical protein
MKKRQLESEIRATTTQVQPSPALYGKHGPQDTSSNGVISQNSLQMASAYHKTMSTIIAVLNTHVQKFTLGRVVPSSEELDSLSSSLVDLMEYHPVVGRHAKMEKAQRAVQMASRKVGRGGGVAPHFAGGPGRLPGPMPGAPQPPNGGQYNSFQQVPDRYPDGSLQYGQQMHMNARDRNGYEHAKNFLQDLLKQETYQQGTRINSMPQMNFPSPNQNQQGGFHGRQPDNQDQSRMRSPSSVDEYQTMYRLMDAAKQLQGSMMRSPQMPMDGNEFNRRLISTVLSNASSLSDVQNQGGPSDAQQGNKRMRTADDQLAANALISMGKT